MNSTIGYPALGLAEAPLEPVHLVRGDTPAVAGASASWTSGVLTWGIAVLVAVALIMVARWRLSSLRGDSARAALRSLSSKLRLNRQERALVESLASLFPGAAPGAVHPVALLLSEDAFIRAAEASLRSGATSDAVTLDALHHKIFEPRPGST